MPAVSVVVLQSPTSLVDVWLDGPLLCHETDVPCGTVTGVGENEKSCTCTTLAACAGSADQTASRREHSDQNEASTHRNGPFLREERDRTTDGLPTRFIR